jgi:hypothetical protein
MVTLLGRKFSLLELAAFGIIAMLALTHFFPDMGFTDPSGTPTTSGVAVTIHYADGSSTDYTGTPLNIVTALASVMNNGKVIVAIDATVSVSITFTGVPSTTTMMGSLQLQFDGLTQRTVPLAFPVTGSYASGALHQVATATVDAAEITTWDAGALATHTLTFLVNDAAVTILFEDGASSSHTFAVASATIADLTVQSDSTITGGDVTINSGSTTQGVGYPLGADLKLYWTDDTAVFESILADMKAYNINQVKVEMPYSYLMDALPVNGQPQWHAWKPNLFDTYFQRFYEEGFIVHVDVMIAGWWDVAGAEGAPLNTIPHDDTLWSDPQFNEYLDVLFDGMSSRWNYPNIVWGGIVEPDGYVVINPAWDFATVFPVCQRLANIMKSNNPDCLTNLALSGYAEEWASEPGVEQWMLDLRAELQVTGLPNFDSVGRAAYHGLGGVIANPANAHFQAFKDAGKQIILEGVATTHINGVPADQLTFAELNPPLINDIIDPALQFGYSAIFVWSWRDASQPAAFGEWMDLPTNTELRDYISTQNQIYGKIFPS